MIPQDESDAFSSVKCVCKFLGIISYKENLFLNILSGVINIVFLAIQFALIFPSLAYFIENISVVANAAEVLSILFPAILHVCQYLLLVFTKTYLIVLFNDFEMLIDKSG